MERKTLFIGLAVSGAIVGALLVRGFFLTPLEEIGFRIFWENNLIVGFNTISKTNAFKKITVGIIIGGACLPLIKLFIERHAKFGTVPEPDNE